MFPRAYFPACMFPRTYFASGEAAVVEAEPAPPLAPGAGRGDWTVTTPSYPFPTIERREPARRTGARRRLVVRDPAEVLVEAATATLTVDPGEARAAALRAAGAELVVDGEGAELVVACPACGLPHRFESHAAYQQASALYLLGQPDLADVELGRIAAGAGDGDAPCDCGASHHAGDHTSYWNLIALRALCAPGRAP